MYQKLSVLITFLFVLSFSHASHILGGDLTWKCQGGQYVFELAYYRDCNGADVNSVAVSINVWGHPTLTAITLPFVSREDFSPQCTEVSGGPSQLTCGVGSNGGTGLGAIEKIIYRSAPTTINGTPPAEGWVFTYDECCRSANISNLLNPSTYGLTLRAIIYDSNSGSGCVDNSPQFLQDPYFVSCAGDDYEYNMNAVDPDLDSLNIRFESIHNYLDGNPYNPPSNPANIPYVNGFSATSPTPNVAMNSSNVPAQINSTSGNLTFKSFNAGTYVVKIVAESYRNGTLIGQVDREMQLIVTNCIGTNSKPIIAAPFGTSFETTVFAGDPVNFSLNATDIELLQDGTPQSNTLTASGLNFSNNFVSTTNCLIAPCPTLNTTPPITMSQGVSTTFNWQTDCNHLVHPFTGELRDEVPYHFVFKVKDDYCPTPKVSYATVTINVQRQTPAGSPELSCIQSNAAGDLIINWNQVTDLGGTFQSYNLYSVSGGLIATYNTIGTTTHTISGGALLQNEYYLTVNSSCNGLDVQYSDTISNILLDVTNPSNGTAVLQWNDPVTTPTSDMGNYYHIYREYPTGIWTLYDSVPYGQHGYIDTIDICQVDLNYQVVLPNTSCDFTSNIDGDSFEDMMTPDIPIIDVVTIDTLTGQVVITWNENDHDDTFGYIIYEVNASGVPIEIDTVWGISNTSYTYSTNTSLQSLGYSVAAFDSCFTGSVPPTYQTSAKAEIHETVFISGAIDICAHSVILSWNNYIGWDAIETYNVYAVEQGGNWYLEGSTTNNSYTANVNSTSIYSFAVEAVHADGRTSFSNIIDINVPLPSGPSFNYLQTATVSGENILLKHYLDDSKVSKVDIQKMNDAGNFEVIATTNVSNTSFTYLDEDVDVNEQSYTYRVQVYDSCGQLGEISNIGKTILLQSQFDNTEKMVYLNWTPYEDFDGSLIRYNIYRGVEGGYPNDLIASLNNGDLAYQDSVAQLQSNGQYCYRITAMEATNSFGFADSSTSNVSCVVFDPLIYIPNAFTPNADNKNEVFIPVLNDFDPEQYSFTVYTRWGKQLFTTSDPNEGWDGTIPSNGNMAQFGTYLYVVSLRDGNGNEVLKRGHVTLFK